MAGPSNPSQCTGVCAQGYIWAQENQIMNPEVCAGQPEGFAAGCGAYLNDTTLGSADGGDDEGDELN
jgi:hypothetical protein